MSIRWRDVPEIDPDLWNYMAQTERELAELAESATPPTQPPHAQTPEGQHKPH